ncbi:MAG: RNA-binding transcriptional accessory protein [Bdellovibrio sp.]|nr:RNA-binding transcriptional accessory protein [Bdellovibrio sp.]
MELSSEVLRDALPAIAAETSVSIAQVKCVLQLALVEECTIPFMTRYRKEVTGNLDEVSIAKILECFEVFQETTKRREFILETIKKMELLTPELEKNIKMAKTLQELEDLYAPYKSKKKSKGQAAIEAGLSPLADLVLAATLPWSQIQTEATKYLKSESKINTAEDALEGARAILIEKVTHHAEAKEKLRHHYWSDALFVTSKRKDAEKIEDWQKYKDYFEFSQKISELKLEKNAHRFMAIRRGMSVNVLSGQAQYPKDKACAVLAQFFIPRTCHASVRPILENIVEKAFTLSIDPSLDLEVKTELKKNADEFAIDIFGKNLKNLLLQPYLGPKSVMGIDPGIRTGCKVAVVDLTGKFLFDYVLYPDRNPDESARIIEALCDKFKIQHIAIGNGTHGRETLRFLEESVSCVKAATVHATLVSEAGASVYSASEIAREEFPDKDATVRGAISIARRFQDPLAELVKIDPKSIGVGQYQHDVNQVKLKKSLQTVVESCVNFCGVDLNTASAPLLSFISGIGPSMAKNIVKYREEKGPFKDRQELLKIGRFTQKIFQQAAGFLRIYNGENPLDATFIHPETYPVLEEWAKTNNMTIKTLTNEQSVIQQFATDTKVRAKLGDFTHQDIVKSIQAPVQDPRSTFKSTEFRKDAGRIEDLKIGEWYPGIVNNITQFGAFVDIGVKESGLLHISQIANKFVTNPMEELKVGEEVKVKILAIDFERKRISLTRRTETSAPETPPAPSANHGKHIPKNETAVKNNAFASLKNFKLR